MLFSKVPIQILVYVSALENYLSYERYHFKYITLHCHWHKSFFFVYSKSLLFLLQRVADLAE